MRAVGPFLSFCLGIGITSVLSPLIKAKLENMIPLIPPKQHPYSIPSVESIVDSRFKLLAAEFQDQFNDLKGQVTTLNSVVMTAQHQHEIQKRQTNTSKPSKRLICENSSSLCTFFHPDHPDAGRKKFNHTATLCDEIVSDPTKVKEKFQNNTSKPKRPICENSSSLCTFFHPDHPDAGRKRFNHSATLPDEIGVDPSKVKGMPSNCSDLRLLGHKLSGLYLVKSSKANQGTKIEAIFCNFQLNVSQEFVGNVDVKTKIVHFYMQRNTQFSNRDVIPFEVTRLNEGGAMDLNTGVFTAPVPGIYHFEFSFIKGAFSRVANIFLQVNGEIIGNAHINSKQPNDWDDYRGLTMIASLRLKSQDRVTLFNEHHGTILENGKYLTHFIGWLVEEDLI